MTETINERLKSIRIELRMNQRDFANKIGIKQGSLSDIERGRIGVSTKVVEKLLKSLNVNPGWLHDGKGDIFIGISPIKTREADTGGVSGGGYPETKSGMDAVEYYRVVNRTFNEIENENPAIKEVYRKVDELIDFTQFMNELNRKYFTDLWFFVLPSLYENDPPPTFTQIKSGVQERLKKIEPMMPALEKLEAAIQQFYTDFKDFDTKHIMEEHKRRETIFKR